MLPGRRQLLATLAAGLLAAGLSHAGTPREGSGRAAPDPRDPVVAPRAALIAAPSPPTVAVPTKLRTRPGAMPGKTEHFIDGGIDLPGMGLTNRERAKLEAARVAVAAARSGSVLPTPATRALDPATPLHALPTDKLERLRSAQPGTVPSDPALSGLPATPGSRQKQGAVSPTTRELEKLKAAAASPVTPETKKETER